MAEKKDATQTALDNTEIEGSIVTAAAAENAQAPGVLQRASIYGTGPLDDERAQQVGTHFRDGAEAIARAHNLSGPATDFVRRALGEIYEHEQGGLPMTAPTQQFVKTFDGGTYRKANGDWLEEQGRLGQQTEFDQLRNKGWSHAGY